MTQQQRAPKRPHTATALRALPSVDVVVHALMAALAAHGDPPAPQSRLGWAARASVQDARDALLNGQPTETSLAALVEHAAARLERARAATPAPVINATGVIINTNLGRAPLSDAALEAIAGVAAGYSALEYDLERGSRGSRQTPVRSLLREVVGAEDALVVNNNAAAILLALSTLAVGREVIIARGELVEIGGGFRIPDVLRQSGARLVEVGTTNRTRASDFEAALTPETALLLSVHPSNYRIIGFTASPSLRELAEIAHQHHLPLIHDLGSGALLRTERWGLSHEPMPQESLAAGADLVCFSGDKLLGGPQAGILAGKAELLSHIERHPLMRAVRIDKLTLAALAATLRAYRDGAAEREIPVWRMITTPVAQIKARAEQWVTAIRQTGADAEAQEGLSTIGGGSLPGETLPTWHCAIAPATGLRQAANPPDTAADDAVATLAARLRNGATPVVARVQRNRLLLDPRTVFPEQDSSLLLALRDALANR
ncbi:MAG: L-seryl-tRNA(Sec) selenium transferase [Nitrososphaerota archaeon]